MGLRHFYKDFFKKHQKKGPAGKNVGVFFLLDTVKTTF